jgi:hypothetical protein
MSESTLGTERQFYVKDQLPVFVLAEAYGRLGRRPEALIYLQTCLERMEQAMAFLRTDHAFDSVRDDPAYREIVRRFDLSADR